MFSFTERRSTPAWLRNLALLAASMVSVPLWGQAPSQTQPTISATNRQFADIGDSLIRKADTLLVSESRDASLTAATQKDGLSGGNSIIPGKQQPGNRSRLGVAAARLELIRPSITPILEKEGIPAELAAVVLVESGGDPAALSPKGARGLWQLMPDTARRYGLAVDSSRDERLDIEKSTHAAARYLSDLYLEFKSWPLALAAYNTGEQNLQRAIDRSRSTEFAVLSTLGFLPAETRNYVPAVMAAIRWSGYSAIRKESQPVSSIHTVFAASSQ